MVVAQKKFSFWPSEVPRENTMAAFAAAFGTLGYTLCDGGSLETGYEKVALYALTVRNESVPTHAARQLPNGWWTSKLGSLEDIEHASVEDVNGPRYGNPVLFMRRPLQN